MPKLEAKKICASYEDEAILDSLDLSVESGEFVSILGPSGCGKSTFLNIIAGLLEKDSGEILVDSEKIDGISEHFSYMPQKDLLFEWKTILENVTLYGTIHHQKKKAVEKALENMELFGLKGYENSYPCELSGGMRQRAAFLRTYLCSADIMLLDEPFAALDVITRGHMQDWLISLNKNFHITTLLVTHDLDEAIYLSDRILVLKGRPAKFTDEYRIPEKDRTREWLFSQEDIRKQIYHALESTGTSC